MLDTIVINGKWPLKIPLTGNRVLNVIPNVKGRTDCSGYYLERAECSLPKLLFGHNGKVIENQSQLDRALLILHEGLSRFVGGIPEIKESDVSRADLVWNYDLIAQPIICGHASLRVPGIQNEATIYRGYSGLSFRGTKSRFMVTLYDKAKQMRTSGSVLRAEISLRGQQLSRRLNADEVFNFNALYRVYREILISIPPILKPKAAADWTEAVGAEPIEIRERIIARLLHKPKETVRRYRCKIEAAAANLADNFSWNDLLPKCAPPASVNVEPTRRK